MVSAGVTFMYSSRIGSMNWSNYIMNLLLLLTAFGNEISPTSDVASSILMETVSSICKILYTYYPYNLLYPKMKDHITPMKTQVVKVVCSKDLKFLHIDAGVDANGKHRVSTEL